MNSVGAAAAKNTKNAAGPPNPDAGRRTRKKSGPGQKQPAGGDPAVLSGVSGRVSQGGARLRRRGLPSVGLASGRAGGRGLSRTGG